MRTVLMILLWALGVSIVMVGGFHYEKILNLLDRIGKKTNQNHPGKPAPSDYRIVRFSVGVFLGIIAVSCFYLTSLLTKENKEPEPTNNNTYQTPTPAATQKPTPTPKPQATAKPTPTQKPRTVVGTFKDEYGEEHNIYEDELIDLKELSPWEAEDMFGRDSEWYKDWAEAVRWRSDFNDLLVDWLTYDPVYLDSTAIESVSAVYPFDVLAITFVNHPKDLYVYYDIPYSMFNWLAEAESPGQYFNAHIKGQYDYDVYKNYFK